MYLGGELIVETYHAPGPHAPTPPVVVHLVQHSPICQVESGPH
jgi:hypothetical protein